MPGKKGTKKKGTKPQRAKMDISIVISDKWNTSFGLFDQVTIFQPDFRTRFLVLGYLALAVQAFLPLLTDSLSYYLPKNRRSASSA